MSNIVFKINISYIVDFRNSKSEFLKMTNSYLSSMLRIYFSLTWFWIFFLLKKKNTILEISSLFISIMSKKDETKCTLTRQAGGAPGPLRKSGVSRRTIWAREARTIRRKGGLMVCVCVYIYIIWCRALILWQLIYRYDPDLCNLILLV